MQPFFLWFAPLAAAFLVASEGSPSAGDCGPTSIAAVPGCWGTPGCTHVITSGNLAPNAACLFDYCDCSGINVPLLPETLSGSTTFGCASWTTQPSANNCPTQPPPVQSSQAADTIGLQTSLLTAPPNEITSGSKSIATSTSQLANPDAEDTIVESTTAQQSVIQSSQAGISSSQTEEVIPEVTTSSVIGNSTRVSGQSTAASSTVETTGTTGPSNEPGSSMMLTSTLNIGPTPTSPGPTLPQSSVTGAFDSPGQTETTIIAGGSTLQYSKETIGSLFTLTAPATITTPIIETSKDGSIFTIPAAVIIVGPGGTWWNARPQGFQISGPSCVWPFCPPTGGGYVGGKGPDNPKNPGSPKGPGEKGNPENDEKQSTSTNSRPESQEAQSTSDPSSSLTTTDSQSSTSSTSSSTSSSTIPTQACSPDCAHCNADPPNSEPKMHKRDLDLKVLTARENSLSSRRLVRPADFDTFLDFFLTQYVWADWLNIHAGRSTGIIHVLENKKKDAAVHGLFGCTSVVVVSKVGVWISHFWQVPSFRADLANYNRARTGPDIANFDEQVIQEMQDGGPNIPGLKPLTAPREIFDEVYKPRWTIVTPRDFTGVVGSWLYQPEVDEIQDVLRELFPNAPPSIIDYEPKSDDDSQMNTPSGKILFQYDPFDTMVQDPNRPCDVYQLARYRLWVEDRPGPAWEGSWAALPSQLITDFSTYYNTNHVPGRKRDNGAACEIPSDLPQASTDTGVDSQAFSPPPNADETHWMTLSPSTLAMTSVTSSFPLTLSGPSTLMTSVSSLSCSLNGAPWFSPASWCECGPSPSSTYPTISTVHGASSADCAYRTRPSSMISPVTISAVPTNIPGLGGIPGCAPVMYPNGQACINADYCNCGGTPAPYLTTTFSGTLTTDCGYTIQPTSSSCPPPTTTMPPPTPPPEPTATVSCNVDSPGIDTSIINSLITDLCVRGNPFGIIPETLDAANPTAGVLDVASEWDEDHPINEVFVSLASGRPDGCDTATATFIFAEREAECSELLASVTASCVQGGGLLQGSGCLDWGVTAIHVADGEEKPT